MLVLLIFGGFTGFIFSVAAVICDFSKRSVISTIVSVILFVIGLIGMNEISNLRYEEVFQTYSYELQPISEDVQNPSATYYVQIPINKNNEIDKYYLTYNDGGATIESCSAKNTTILQDNTCTPHVVKKIVHSKSELDGSLLAFLTLGAEPSLNEEEVYEIYVPSEYCLITHE